MRQHTATLKQQQHPMGLSLHTYIPAPLTRTQTDRQTHPPRQSAQVSAGARVPCTALQPVRAAQAAAGASQAPSKTLGGRHHQLPQEQCDGESLTWIALILLLLLHHHRHHTRRHLCCRSLHRRAGCGGGHPCPRQLHVRRHVATPCAHRTVVLHVGLGEGLRSESER